MEKTKRYQVDFLIERGRGDLFLGREEFPTCQGALAFAVFLPGRPQVRLIHCVQIHDRLKRRSFHLMDFIFSVAMTH